MKVKPRVCERCACTVATEKANKNKVGDDDDDDSDCGVLLTV